MDQNLEETISNKKKKLDYLNKFFKELYLNFNARKIELVIAKMTDEIKWANGMDGGYVFGHDGVREYWLRQFKTVSSTVTPIKIEEVGERVRIKVHQVVYDMEGKLLADEIVNHFFSWKMIKLLPLISA